MCHCDGTPSSVYARNIVSSVAVESGPRPCRAIIFSFVVVFIIIVAARRVCECDVACSIRISDEAIVIYRGGQSVATSPTLNYTFIWCTICQLTLVQSRGWASMLLPKAQTVRTIRNCRERTDARLRPPHSFVESEFRWVACETETKWKEHKAIRSNATILSYT